LKLRGARVARWVMAAPQSGQEGVGVSGSLGEGSPISPQTRQRTRRRVLNKAP